MGDFYAFLLGGGHVDTVVTDAKNRNHFDVGKHRQQLTVYLGRAAHAHKGGDFGECLGVKNVRMVMQHVLLLQIVHHECGHR